MLIGFVSDTHDNLPLIDRAVVRLNEEGVGLVLHAGDYISPFVIPRFGGLKSKLIGVFGNNDGDHEHLVKSFNEYGAFEIRGRFAQITCEGLKIALLHGSDMDLLEALVGSESFDVVVYGHVHHPNVYRKGNTLIVNPGEVCGYLTGKSTIVLFDTTNKEAKIVEL